MYRGFNEILVEKENKLLLIKFSNRKKNALNRIAYSELARVLREVANDESVTIVVITGDGDFFTSGNDLSQTPNNEDVDALVNESMEAIRQMITALLDCPKVVIALVNGPCIGIGMTLAGLCDLVWCSETAYFQTPFTMIGLVPEACSSYLFPILLGRSKATEMLLFSQKMSAQEAYHYNFVSKVFPLNQVNSLIWPKIKEFSQLPPESMQISKQLLGMHVRDSLYKALDAECKELKKRFYSEEFLNALLKFSARKKRSSKL